MPITVVAIFLLDFFNPYFLFIFFLLHDKNHGLHEDSGSGIVNRGGVRGHRILGLHCHAVKNINANHSIQKD